MAARTVLRCGQHSLLGLRLVRTGLKLTVRDRTAVSSRLYSTHDNSGEYQNHAETASPAEQSPLPLIYPSPRGASKHHDLASFLRHAERAGLDPTTTTYVGTHYEYTVAAHLAPLGFDLRRVGGASDRGIDLLGTWTVPTASASSSSSSPPPTIRVIVQCKAGAGQRIGPHLVRELEGAFVGAPVGWRCRSGETADRGSRDADAAAVLGLLVTERPATKGIRDALTRSRWPMAFVCCSGTGHLQQMLWNRQAEREGSLAGVGVTLRHEDGLSPSIVLTKQGVPLPPAPISHAETT